MQDQELETAFEAGPSHQHEISMKGVGTFRIEEPESVRLLARKQRAQVTCQLAGCMSECATMMSPDTLTHTVY